MTIPDDGYSDGGEPYSDEEMALIAMDELTISQVQSYINDSGNHCPFCNSNNIEGDEIEVTGMGANQIVYCCDCDRRWIDIYTLTSVTEYPK